MNKKIKFLTYFFILIVESLYFTAKSQNITKLIPSIIKTGDSLIIIGSNVSAIKYKSYPDSGFLQFSKLTSIPIPYNTNTNDSAFLVPIPLNLTNKLYEIYVLGYKGGEMSIPHLLRVFDFSTDLIGLTIWGATINGISEIPDSIRKIVYLSAGNGVSFVIKETGEVVGWGNSNFDQLNIPQSLTDVVDIRGGAFHVVALKSDGSLVSWGRNLFNTVSSTPKNIKGFKNIATGSYYSCAVKYNDSLICWGYYDNKFFTPNSKKKIESISAGGEHLLILYNDGTIESTGSVEFGQNFIPYLNNKNIIKISAGAVHNSMLNKSGEVFSWGGDGNYNIQPPANLPKVKDIASSANHTLALLRDSTLIAWGSNEFNQSKIPAGLNKTLTINGNSNTQRNFVIHIISVKTEIDKWGQISESVDAKNGATIKITYHYPSHYLIDSIFINGTYNPQATKDSLNSYTFYNLKGVTNIYVKLKRIFWIETKAINGRIDSSFWIDSLSSKIINFSTDNKNYFIDSIFINDQYWNKDYINLNNSIFLDSIKSDFKILILYSSPKPPQIIEFKDSLNHIQCFKSNGQEKFLNVKVHNILNRINNHFPLTHYQWFFSKIKDTTMANMVLGGLGDLNSTDTMLRFLIPDTVIDSGYYFVKIYNSFGIFTISPFSGKIITNPIPNIELKFNINDSLLCLPLGDTIQISFTLNNNNNDSLNVKMYEKLTPLHVDSIIKITKKYGGTSYFTNYFKQLLPQKRIFYTVVSNVYNCVYQSPNIELQWYDRINIDYNKIFNYDSVYCASENTLPFSISVIGLNSQLIKFFWYRNKKPQFSGAELINAKDSIFFPPNYAKNNLGDTIFYSVIVADKLYNCALDTLNKFSQIITLSPKIEENINSSTLKQCLYDSSNYIEIKTNSLFKNNIEYLWLVKNRTNTSQYYSSKPRINLYSNVPDTHFYQVIIKSTAICPNLFDTSDLSGPIITYPIPEIKEIDSIFNVCLFTNKKLIPNYYYLWADSINFEWLNEKNELISNKSFIDYKTDLLKQERMEFKISNSQFCTSKSKYFYFNGLPLPQLYLDSSSKPLVVIKNYSLKLRAYGASYFLWQPSMFFKEGLSFSGQAQEFKSEISQWVTIKSVDSATNCFNTDSFYINVFNEEIDIFPSKIITPNKDGLNDYWTIKNIEFYPENEIIIYNKANHKVKTFKNYHPLNQWAVISSYFNELPNGQYFYVIYLYKNTIKIKEKKGYFSVLR